jgi:sodium-coupled monocarboxylate transporter 8/12
MLGSRQMPWFAVTISMIMGLFSAVSFVAIPGEAYSNGLGMWLAAVLSFLVIPISIWMFLRFYYRLGSFTPYEYLERRFSPTIRLFASLVFLVTRGFYLAVVLYATARAFEGAFGWNGLVTILLIGAIGTFYTVAGGMKAVIWTDIMLFCVLTGGIIATAIVITWQIKGGVCGVFSYAFEHGRGFNLDASFFSFNPHQRLTIWWMILYAFGTSIGAYASDQIAIQKLLSTKSYKEAKWSAYMKVPIVLGVTGILWFIGLALFTYYNQSNPQQAFTLTGDKALAYFITTAMPVPMPGFIMAALLAATLATISAGLSSLPTVALKDIYVRFIDSDISEQAQLILSRAIMMAASIFMMGGALAIAWLSDKRGSTVFETVAIWLSLNGIIVGIFFLGVTSTRVGAKAVLWISTIATVALALAIAILYYGYKPENRISFIITGNIGLLVTICGGYICALFSKKQGPMHIDGLTLRTKNMNVVREEKMPLHDKLYNGIK